MQIERAFGPHDVVREQHFVFRGELRRDTLIDLLIGPATGAQALALRSRGTRNADRGVELSGRFGFEEQGDHHNGHRATLGAPGLELGLPRGADARMKNLLEFAARCGVKEHELGQCMAAQVAIAADDFVAKQSFNFRKGGPARLDELAGDNVRVDHGQTVLAQQIGGSRFAHANAAGEAEGFHGP